MDTMGLYGHEQRRSGNPFIIFVATATSFSFRFLLCVTNKGVPRNAFGPTNCPVDRLFESPN